MKKTLLLVSFLIFSLGFSQTKTKYELKKEQLTLELFKNLGIGEYEISLIKNEKDEAKKTNMFFSRLKSIPNSYENQQLLQNYYQEMQKANALKTKVDFDREEERKRKYEQELLLANQEKEAKRKAEEQEREKQNLEAEARHEAERKELVSKKTDIANDFISKGDVFFNNKKYDEAVTQYEKAIQTLNEINIKNQDLENKLLLATENKKKSEEKKQRNLQLINAGTSILNSLIKK